MTRSSCTRRLTYDPEIEKTARRATKQAKLNKSTTVTITTIHETVADFITVDTTVNPQTSTERVNVVTVSSATRKLDNTTVTPGLLLTSAVDSAEVETLTTLQPIIETVDLSEESSIESDEENNTYENMGDAPPKTLREMAAPDVDQAPIGITFSEVNTSFELKPGLIQLLPKFYGLPGEDPNKHLMAFHLACSSQKNQAMMEDDMKLCAFPFTLLDKAKD
jgi:hypothetical protein